MKEVKYQPVALKVLGRITKNTSKRIIDKTNIYAEKPDSCKNNIIQMTNRGGIRLRVGNWRVIMKDDEVLHILNHYRLASVDLSECCSRY